MTHDDDHPAHRVGVLATAASVLSAFFGVQSARTRERDFTRGSPALFIAVGGVLTLGLVVVLASIVRVLVGSTAGG